MAIDKRIRSNHALSKSKKKILQALLKGSRPRNVLHGFRNLRLLRLGFPYLRSELCRCYKLAQTGDQHTRTRFKCPTHKEKKHVTPKPVLNRSVTDPLVTNMHHFYPTATFESVPRGDFARVRMLASGINGDVFQYRWCKQGSVEDVAVKMVRNKALQRAEHEQTNERHLHLLPETGRPSAEDALTEIGVLSFLSKQHDLPRFILSLLAVFADDHHTWVVLELADGGELFDVAAAGTASDEQTQTYMSQLLQAVSYLHRRHIGHRDISLENVLLKGNEVRLMDFGASVRSHSASGSPLRFFRTVGKDFYRAPECYVPRSEKVWAEVPKAASGGAVVMLSTEYGHLCEVRLPANAVPEQKCEVDVWGYAAHPADIFSVGICLFILGFKCPAWNFARLDNSSFNYVYHHGDEGIAGLVQRYGLVPMPPAAMQLLSGMLRTDPARRYSVDDCLSSEWLAKDNQ